MTPYYDDGRCVIYHGDCRDVLPSIDPAVVALVLTDPPYGIAERTDRQHKGRGATRGRTTTGMRLPRSGHLPSRDHPPVFGDDEPFDPTHLLVFRRLILFGANHYANRLPTSPSWIVWDKLAGLTTAKRFVGVDDNADVEMAWSNLGGPARLIPHRWKGLVRASERGERVLHPTQKPVALMAYLLLWRTEAGDLVLDPYMGSGPVLCAAKRLGRRAVGIDVDERYCELAAKRLAQGVLDFGGAA